MSTTSHSLLERLKAARPDDSDWVRLQKIYLPMIRKWIARVPGLSDEMEDIAQEVMAVLSREIGQFERRREGSFRAWLRQVVVFRMRSWRRSQRRRPALGLDLAEGFLDELADPNGDLAREWDLDHDRHVFAKLMAIIGPDFSPSTWEAFRLYALEGRDADDVARDLGMTRDAVTRAKSRILKRLRTEAGDLLE